MLITQAPKVVGKEKRLTASVRTTVSTRPVVDDSSFSAAGVGNRSHDLAAFVDPAGIVSEDEASEMSSNDPEDPEPPEDTACEGEEADDVDDEGDEEGEEEEQSDPDVVVDEELPSQVTAPPPRRKLPAAFASPGSASKRSMIQVQAPKGNLKLARSPQEEVQPVATRKRGKTPPSKVEPAAEENADECLEVVVGLGSPVVDACEFVEVKRIFRLLVRHSVDAFQV